MRRIVLLVVALGLIGVIPSASHASHAGCAPGSPALGSVTVGHVTGGDPDWYDASSTETQYIRANHGGFFGSLQIRAYAWDGATGCTLVAQSGCTFFCYHQPANIVLTPGSFQVEVTGNAGDYVVTSLPTDPPYSL